MRHFSLVALVLLLTVPMFGCGGSTKPAVNNLTSQQETDLGNQALANGDYVSANAHYKAAIAKDPSNGEAQFGAGVSEVYLLKDDAEVQAVQNQIPHARASLSPLLTSRADRADGLRQQLATLRGGVDSRYAPMAMGKAYFRTLLLAADAPDSASDVQAIIRNKVMPKLQYAEERLNAAEADPNFSLLLPPAITGLPDTIEIDKTDVYLLDAIVNNVQGWCGLLIAYNLDVENGDFELVNAESLFASGTAWATLNTDGALALSSARLNFLNVKGKFDAAVTNLTAETDDQSNDVVPQNWLLSPEYGTVLDGINKVYDSLNGAVTVTVNDAYAQPMDIQVHIGLLFEPAITDLKTKFPALVFTANSPDIERPITFPDPTISGIFPDMTDARWQQLTGLTAPVSRWRGGHPVAVR